MTLSHPARGFALVEAVLSIVIVSVMLVASLRTVAAARAGQTFANDRLRGVSLAQDLMTEICDKPYSDPDETPIFGPEPTEVLAGRTAFDDVDDYAGYSASPPRDRSNVLMSGLANWGRSVEVVWVNPADLTQASLVETGVKRITVTVTRRDVPVARLVALRTAAGG
jgi:hypothetical protein